MSLAASTFHLRTTSSMMPCRLSDASPSHEASSSLSPINHPGMKLETLIFFLTEKRAIEDEKQGNSIKALTWKNVVA